MTHAEFDLQSEYATVKFFEVFAFVVHFQAIHLETEIESIISKESLVKLLTIRRSLEELAEKADQRIAKEKINDEFVIDCPNCQYYTFVIQDDINTCYTCRHSEEIFTCENCNKPFFDWQMEDFSNEFDTDYCEGQGVIHNNFGYNYHDACTECAAEIKEDIAKQRLDEDDYNEMEADYYRDREAEYRSEMEQFYR